MSKHRDSAAFPSAARHGLTKREYFAAHCPSDLAKIGNRDDAAILMGTRLPEDNDIIGQLEWNAALEAKLRYIYAEAMLAESGKE